MVLAFPTEVVQLIDTGMAIVRGAQRDKNRLKVCVKEVKAYDERLRASLDNIRALNIENDDFVTLLMLLGGFIFKRDLSLKNIEIHINNNNLLKDGIIEFQKISEDMSGKSRKLSEELKVLAPSSTFPIIDDFVDFYSDSSGNPMGDMEVSDLRDAITGICKGIVPVTVFEEKLATLIIKNEALYERILKLSQDPQIVPIKEAIEKQKETLVRIKNYSVNKDKEYLVKGLEDLKERPDCLEKANEVISLKEMEENFITCFRCLEINSTDLQFCKRCKAVLITEVDS